MSNNEITAKEAQRIAISYGANKAIADAYEAITEAANDGRLFCIIDHSYDVPIELRNKGFSVDFYEDSDTSLIIRWNSVNQDR